MRKRKYFFSDKNRHTADYTTGALVVIPEKRQRGQVATCDTFCRMSRLDPFTG